VLFPLLPSRILSAKLLFVTDNTGQFLAVGTSSGAVGQYIKPSAVSIAAWLQNAENGEGLRTTELYRVNEVSCSALGAKTVRVAVKGAVFAVCSDSVYGRAVWCCSHFVLYNRRQIWWLICT
jgi:hypothetical protein